MRAFARSVAFGSRMETQMEALDVFDDMKRTMREERREGTLL